MSTTRKKARKKPKADAPTIKDFMSAVGFRLDCGYEFQWECYGDEACGIGWTKEDNSASAGIVYDKKTHVVYELSVWDDLNDTVLVWMRPGFKARHDRESIRRGFDPRMAYDLVKRRLASPSKCFSLLKALMKRKLHERRI